MNVIFSMKEKQRERQINYERKVLRDLPIVSLEDRLKECLGTTKIMGVPFNEIIKEGCFDIAIESYLLGAHYSKFGYYGESEENVRKRCYAEEKHLIDTLFNFILFWGKVGESGLYQDSLYMDCERYIDVWWKDGFKSGGKRHKMKLH